MFFLPNNQLARLLAYVTGLVNPKLLLQNEHLIAENRTLCAHFPLNTKRCRSGAFCTLYVLRQDWERHTHCRNDFAPEASSFCPSFFWPIKIKMYRLRKIDPLLCNISTPRHIQIAMIPNPAPDITGMLERWNEGDPTTLDRLI